MDQNHILIVSPRELLRQPNVVDPQAAIDPSVPILFYSIKKIIILMFNKRQNPSAKKLAANQK